MSSQRTWRCFAMDRSKVKVFLGANQAKIPVALAAAIQAASDQVQSMCFSIFRFKCPRLPHRLLHRPSLRAGTVSLFHIISKDTGFDPLVVHLKVKGIFAQRSICSNIPYFKPTLPSTSDAQIGLVVAHLAKMKAAKPRAEKTLLGTLHVLFKKELSDQQLSSLFATLCKRGIVKLDGTKVSYDLPLGP